MNHVCQFSLLYLYLLTPPHQPVPLPPETPAGWHFLKQFNLTYQLVGPHEQYGPWASECSYTRRQYHDLKDCPRLEEGEILPTWEQCQICLKLANRDLEQAWLDMRGTAFSSHRAVAWQRIEAAQAQVVAWSLCSGYRNESRSWVERRNCLGGLIK